MNEGMLFKTVYLESTNAATMFLIPNPNFYNYNQTYNSFKMLPDFSPYPLTDSTGYLQFQVSDISYKQPIVQLENNVYEPLQPFHQQPFHGPCNGGNFQVDLSPENYMCPKLGQDWQVLQDDYKVPSFSLFNILKQK